MSRRLIEKIQGGKSCGGGSKSGVTKGGLLNKGGHWMKDFPSIDEEEKKRREAEGGG